MESADSEERLLNSGEFQGNDAGRVWNRVPGRGWRVLFRWGTPAMGLAGGGLSWIPDTNCPGGGENQLLKGEILHPFEG